jgi:excisionase family DNA binding protein
MSATIELEKDWRELTALTVSQAARILNIGRNTAYEAVKRGELPSVRFAGRILVPVGELRVMLGEITPNRNGSDR